MSTLLSTLSGPGNDLWIDLCADPVPLHCAPEQLDLALIEAVTHMRGLLSGTGTIAVRTRRVNFHAILALGARELGAAAFRFGSLRVPPRAALTTLFGAARRLAAGAHGRVRLHGSATLILRLPTVLRLAAGRRPDTSATTPHSRPKEKTHEDRQPVAA